MSIWDDMLDRGEGAIRKEDKAMFMTSDEISPKDLENMMRSGIVHFQYRKKPKKGKPEDSGEIRDAWGTKENSVITKIPHGGECPPKNAGYTIYFDMEKEDWRAFLDSRLIGIWNEVYDSIPEFEKAYAEFNKEEVKSTEEPVIPEE